MGDVNEVVQDPATMGALGRRSLLLAAILAPCIVLTVWLVVSESRSVRVADVAEKAIPATIDDGKNVWTSTKNTFSDAEMDILETHDYMYRTYDDGRGRPVDLCVIFSEDNRKGTHPPDVCLEGAGNRILERSEREVVVGADKVDVRELVTNYGEGRYMYFAYFYKCGDSFTPSFYKQQAMIVWYGMTGRNAAGALLRYSTPMTDAGSLAEAKARVDALLAVTFPYIKDRLNVNSKP